MSSLLVYGLLALAILGALGGIGHAIYEAGADAVRLEWEQANARAREQADARAGDASAGLEVEREKSKVVYRTITKNVDRYIDRTVYKSECFDADGLRDARAAIAGATAPAREPDRAVPAAPGAGGRAGRNGAPVGDRGG